MFLSHQPSLVHIFFQMFVLFMLTAPLITMRLVAEERKLRTLEVLLTAPVSEFEIVLAKFVASMSLIALMLLLSASYAAVLAWFGDPDFGPIWRYAASLPAAGDRAHQPPDARRVHRAGGAAAAVDGVLRRVGMVEAAVSPAAAAQSRMRFAAPLAAALLVVLLAAITMSGHWPELRQMVPFTSKGLVTITPSDVTRVEIRAGQETVALRREFGGWTIDGTTAAVPADLASHIDAGLRLVHVSEPAREIAAEGLTAGSFADFGLDPPASAVALNTAQGAVATINFGVLNPAGNVRLGGAATVYLMARHVGTEWQVAGDVARRLRGQAEPAVVSRGTSLLLPVSMAQVWAVEIVFAGKLTRFERDGAGDWFRHVGQHAHTTNNSAHVADPAQARLIGTALEAFDTTAVETRVGRAADAAQLAQFGLYIPAGHRAALCARQFDGVGASGIRRVRRQPRSLRPSRAER